MKWEDIDWSIPAKGIADAIDDRIIEEFNSGILGFPRDFKIPYEDEDWEE